LATTLPAVLGAPKSVSPASCRSDGSGCQLGVLQPGQTVEVKYVLAAIAAVNSPETGTVTSPGPAGELSGPPTTNTAIAQIVIQQPVLTVNPAIGPQGFVTQATGTGFPPGATVKLTWSAGISQTPGLVTVKPDGTIDAQVLIFHHDQVGPRALVATSVSGTRFGPVPSGQFLVVPRGAEPPLLGSPTD